LNDEQAIEMAKAIATMDLVATNSSSRLSSSETLLGNPPPSLVTETATPAPGSPSSCFTCSTKSSLSQVAVEFAQQIMEALKSTNTNQMPPPPPPVEPSDTEKPKARASTLEFKKVIEV
jgi:hypothetical protein